MAKLNSAEIANRLHAARSEGREPMHVRNVQKVPPAVRRLNAILERRERGH